jgi:hypothetical protein
LEIAAAKAWGEELPKSCPYFQPQWFIIIIDK